MSSIDLVVQGIHNRLREGLLLRPSCFVQK